MAKILLVEDYADIRVILARLLAPKGHDVIEAGDGQQAVETAREQIPDLILMDMSLPVMSGWDATRAIKSDPATAHIPIIALTAHAMRGDRERAWEAGCDGFITKPIDAELLEHTIDQVLEERQEAGAGVSAAPAKVSISDEFRQQQKTVVRVHNEQVLIADGDARRAGEVAAELKSHGFRTTIAETDAQAIALIEAEPPDMIICDAALPDADGYQFTSRVKHDPALPLIPVLLVSDSDGDWQKGLDVGVDDFITRPIQAGKLLARVRTLCRLKRAVAAEAGRANELASVLSQMVTGLMITGADGAITVVNGRGLEILGQSLDDVIGVRVEELVERLNLQDEECTPLAVGNFPLVRAFSHSETVTNQLICFQRRDGQDLVLRFYASPIYSERGQKMGAVSLFDDVTEEVHSRRELHEQKREIEETNAHLQENNQLKSRFIANMAHEVRTPIAAIGALAELLKRIDDQLPPDARDVAARLHNNVQYLNSLVDELLDYSKLVAGKEVVKISTVAPREIVEEIAESFRERAAQQGTSLEVQMHPGLPQQVQIDPIKCRQIVTNLVSNAIKYTKDGQVQIVARPLHHGRFWAVQVKDTGRGIAPEELSKVFDEYHRGADAGQDAPSGSGLGLPITKRLTELMGGRIEVDSTPGAGSCFIAQWPVDITPFIEKT